MQEMIMIAVESYQFDRSTQEIRNNRDVILAFIALKIGWLFDCTENLIAYRNPLFMT
jgi:hypothetical protein